MSKNDTATCGAGLKPASLKLFKDIVKKQILRNLGARIGAMIVRSCQAEAGQVFLLCLSVEESYEQDSRVSVCWIKWHSSVDLKYMGRCRGCNSRFETSWRNESEMNCSQLWQVAPEYPVPEQSQEKELQVWEQRPPCSHRLGRHLKKTMVYFKDIMFSLDLSAHCLSVESWSIYKKQYKPAGEN